MVFFEHIVIALRTSIRFTMEVEEGGRIPFLDLEIRKEVEGVRFSVHRKEVHRDSYLHRESCHPKPVFRGVVRSLVSRADRICSTECREGEGVRIEMALRKRGYANRELAVVRRRAQGGERQLELGSGARRYSLTYYPGIYERISRVLAQVGRRVTGRPVRRLADSLVRKRQEEKVPLGVVYVIKCGMCEWSYVGETSRTLKERLKEHRRMVTNMSDASEIARHVMETGHRMEWDKADILAKEENYGRRIFKEAWWTKKMRAGNKVKCNVDDMWDAFC